MDAKYSKYIRPDTNRLLNRPEPIYRNVAERVYHSHDALVVGRVDCSKYSQTCLQYQIEAYPTILYINNTDRVAYNGPRDAEAIVDFAHRLIGPKVRIVIDCDQLKQVANKHDYSCLLVGSNKTHESHNLFYRLASSLQSILWLYHIERPCKGFAKHSDAIYMMKKHLRVAYRFKNQPYTTSAINEWLRREMHPVFREISWSNFDRAIKSNKTLILAVLDEYKPAKKFSPTSKQYHKGFETMVTETFAHNERNLYFGWTSDMDLMRYVVLGSELNPPNTVLISPDLKYHIASSKPRESDAVAISHTELKQLIHEYKANRLYLTGGDSYMHSILRTLLSNIARLVAMYSASPLLTLLLIGLPSSMLAFVIWSTCREVDEDAGADSDRENIVQDDEGSSSVDSANSDAVDDSEGLLRKRKVGPRHTNTRQ